MGLHCLSSPISGTLCRLDLILCWPQCPEMFRRICASHLYWVHIPESLVSSCGQRSLIRL